MSGTSFPRAEHIALLRERIEQRVRGSSPSVQIEERGVNHLKCQYKFGLRNKPDGEWRELAIHFQVAERLQAGGDGTELDGIIEKFLFGHSAERTAPPIGSTPTQIED
jgi:hypothetical protein